MSFGIGPNRKPGAEPEGILPPEAKQPKIVDQKQIAQIFTKYKTTFDPSRGVASKKEIRAIQEELKKIDEKALNAFLRTITTGKTVDVQEKDNLKHFKEMYEDAIGKRRIQVPITENLIPYDQIPKPFVTHFCNLLFDNENFPQTQDDIKNLNKDELKLLENMIRGSYTTYKDLEKKTAPHKEKENYKKILNGEMKKLMRNAIDSTIEIKLNMGKQINLNELADVFPATLKKRSDQSFVSLQKQYAKL